MKPTSSSPASWFTLSASWRRFKWGLGVFLAGMAGLLLTGHGHPVAYYMSMTILLSGFVLAMAGYAGIFWQRISGLNPRRKSTYRDN